MRRLRSLVGILLCVGLSLAAITPTALGAPAGESGEPALAFAEPEALETSCAELAGASGESGEGGARVRVRNETAKAQSIHVGLELSDEDGNDLAPAQACGGLTFEAKTRSGKLGPGESTVVILSAEENSEGEAISGAMLVYGSGGRVAHRELKIAAAAAGPAVIDATPLVTSASGELEVSETGPLWIPVAADSPAAEVENQGTKEHTIGALTGPGDPVAVVYKGSHEALGEAAKLKLELAHGLSPGTYTGQVDLAPEDTEGGIVALTVKVKRSIWWLVGWLLLGIIISIVLLAFSGRMVPGARLRGRVASLADRCHKVVTALAKEDGGARNWDEFRIKDLGERQQSLTERIDEALGKVLVKVEQSALESIESEIKIVEGQIDELKEIPFRARGVETALQLPRAIQLPDPSDGPKLGPLPEIDVKAAEAIQGGEIATTEVKSRLAEMAARAEQVKALRRQEKELERVFVQRKLLVGDSRLKGLDYTLADARRLLWEAEGAEELTAAAAKVQKAGDTLGEIKIKPETEQGIAEGQVAEALKLPQLADPALVIPPVETGKAPPTSPAPAAAGPPLGAPLTREEAKKAVDTAFWVQLVAVGLSLLLALASGVGALYGDTWGTTKDFLVAVAWGGAAQAVTSTLVTSLDGLGALSWLRRA